MTGFALFAALLLASLTLGSNLPAAELVEHQREGGLAPVYGLNYVGDNFDDDYIVRLRQNHTLERHFQTIGRDFSTSEGFNQFGFGYSMILTNRDLRDEVRRDPGVLFLETNEPLSLMEPVDSSDVEWKYDEPSELEKRYTQKTGTGAPYGLQMLAAKGKLPVPVPDWGNYDYVEGAGLGVNVYVLDSGIRTSHLAFQGRASNFGGLRATDKSPYVRDTMDDKRGHGTHVAGIIGARTYGVAPHANLISVKIANNDGKTAPKGVIAQAIRDVINEHDKNKAKDYDDDRNPFRFRGSLINMSWGFSSDKESPSEMLYQILDAEKAGIKMYASAGNKNIDAYKTYPCSYAQVSCIAAVDNRYEKAWFSNYGRSVNFVAPGNEIISLGISDDRAVVKDSGTSMATAYATGAAAIFTFWQGLVNDQSHNWHDYVWYNSLDGLTTGFSGTTTHFVNTGIHSKKKYNNEPFRWAGEWPVKNHMVDDEAVTASPVQVQQMTTFATEFKVTTVPPIDGMITETDPGTAVDQLRVPTVSSSFSPSFDVSSVISALSTVTFSFDPTTSSATSATAAP